MTISEHITTFAGRPVVAYPPAGEPPADPAAVAWRIEDPEYDGSEEFERRLTGLAAEPWVSQVTALVIGAWGSAYDSGPPVDLIAGVAPQLSALDALFLGEMTFEECEISWINHTDVTPLLEAFPRLATLTIRGSEGLFFKSGRLESLRSLTFQSGGLPSDIVRAVGDSELPNLTHLELWLGTDNYGGDATVEDLVPILAGGKLPALTSLGLRNAEIADMVAAALASAPIVARLEVLDLSLGMLSDVGASALLAGQPLTHLRKLDLHHHFITQPVMDRLTAELTEAGVEVDLSEAGDPEDEDERYIAVSE
ncbi:STM4015 family protein [Catelliglobosispora koreensis]|uniref:STM4015 family protein n=1 Tax=Catelliglobosispora koreensis TaxID=129052 RepID=UPI00035F28D3|nr:STM4015 family protein [Catelliglobosispora koreensis]